MDEPLVRYEVDDGVATVTLNRPDRRNGLTAELSAALLEAVERAAGDDAARVVVLRGAGTHFCVGADLGGGGEEAAASPTTSVPAIARSLRVPMRAAELLHTVPKPTIAAVQGAAAGAGIGLALACDLRVLAEGTVLRTAFVAAGLSGDFGSTWLLTHLVGTARARQLFLLNEKLDAATALDWGLATRVVPAGELDAEVAALARQLADAAPLALAAAKANLNDALTVGFQEALAREAQRQAELYLTQDVTEAARAFVEKRAPRFQGR